MLTNVAQRWRAHRTSYRPAGEPIRTRDYEVAVIATDREARAFVEKHHYEHAYVAARLRVGLYRGPELVGVAVLSQPPSQAVLAAALPGFAAGVELGRLVLLDDVPANGESFFLGRVFALARERFDGLVAHSDPMPRRDSAGRVFFAGHVGTIYQASNAIYCGLTPARTRRIFREDGSVLSARLLSKLRSRDRGWRYGVEMLLAHGAPPPAGDWRTWLRGAVELVSRPVRHGGSHRYVWALDRRARRALPEGQPYPKLQVT